MIRIGCYVKKALTNAELMATCKTILRTSDAFLHLDKNLKLGKTSGDLIMRCIL